MIRYGASDLIHAFHNHELSLPNLPIFSVLTKTRQKLQIFQYFHNWILSNALSILRAIDFLK